MTPSIPRGHKNRAHPTGLFDDLDDTAKRVVDLSDEAIEHARGLAGFASGAEAGDESGGGCFESDARPQKNSIAYIDEDVSLLPKHSSKRGNIVIRNVAGCLWLYKCRSANRLTTATIQHLHYTLESVHNHLCGVAILTTVVLPFSGL